MQIKFSFYLLVLVFISGLMITQGCNSIDNPEVKALHEEVMEIHDRVMPEMSTTRKLRKALSNQQSNPQIEGMVNALSNAEEVMMDWMAEYKIPKEAKIEDQLKYLEQEKIKAKNMEQLFINAISQAKSYLEE